MSPRERLPTTTQSFRSFLPQVAQQNKILSLSTATRRPVTPRLSPISIAVAFLRQNPTMPTPPYIHTSFKLPSYTLLYCLFMPSSIPFAYITNHSLCICSFHIYRALTLYSRATVLYLPFTPTVLSMRRHILYIILLYIILLYILYCISLPHARGRPRHALRVGPDRGGGATANNITAERTPGNSKQQKRAHQNNGQKYRIATPKNSRHSIAKRTAINSSLRTINTVYNTGLRRTDTPGACNTPELYRTSCILCCTRYVSRVYMPTQ